MIYLTIALGIFCSILFFLVLRLRGQIEQLTEIIVADIPIDSDTDKEIRESFLKFISDSREWAFDYIEKTQDSLNHLVLEMEPIISKESFDSNDINTIRKSFLSIKNMLPGE